MIDRDVRETRSARGIVVVDTLSFIIVLLICAMPFFSNPTNRERMSLGLSNDNGH